MGQEHYTKNGAITFAVGQKKLFGFVLKRISVFGFLLAPAIQLHSTPPQQLEILHYPFLEAPLISDTSSSEREMRARINYSPVLGRMSAVNGKQSRYSRYASRLISEDEEKRLEELLFKYRNRSCSYYFDHFRIFDAYLYAITPKRRKLRSSPIAVNDSKEEEEYEKDHLHSTNNSQTEETAPLAGSQENKFTFSRSFLALAADSASPVAGEATTDGETSGSNNPGTPDPSLVKNGEYVVEQPGTTTNVNRVEFSFPWGNSNNWWTQDENKGELKTKNNDPDSLGYTNPTNTIVVLRSDSVTETPIEVDIAGVLTPKDIVIASGNYQLIPAQNSSQHLDDGWLGGESNLYVCAGASLKLTDNNHHKGNTYIYGTVNLEGSPEAKKEGLSDDDEYVSHTGKLGTGDVYVYLGGTLTIGTGHLNNSSLNIEGGTVTLGEPLLGENDELIGYTLLKNPADIHDSLQENKDPVAIRLGAGGSGGTLDLTGSWANGYYQLYSGVLTSTTEKPHKHFGNDNLCYNGKISGKIDIDIAAGDTLTIHNIMFTRDLEEVHEHEHKATIDNGGQLKLTGSTDMKLHELTLDLTKNFDPDNQTTTPILFENYENTSLAVKEMNIKIDDATLEALIANSENGKVAYQAVSIIDSEGNVVNTAISNYVKAEFTSIKVNDGSRWKAEINTATGTLFFMAIPEPAAFALTIGLASVVFAGMRRRRKRD